MARTADPAGVRLSELIACLSLGTDLGLGQPMEHVQRQCLIALRLGQNLGLGAEEREAVYYGGLLAWIGCHVDAYEQATWLGDDIRAKGNARLVDFRSTAAGTRCVLAHLGSGRPALERARVGLAFLTGGYRGRVDLVTLGGHEIGRAVFAPGWKWSENVKPIAGTHSCEFPHFMYVVSGRMRVVMDDGTEALLGPGDLATVAPGHDAEVIGEEACVVIDMAEEDGDHAKRA